MPDQGLGRHSTESGARQGAARPPTLPFSKRSSSFLEIRSWKSSMGVTVPTCHTHSNTSVNVTVNTSVNKSVNASTRQSTSQSTHRHWRSGPGSPRWGSLCPPATRTATPQSTHQHVNQHSQHNSQHISQHIQQISQHNNQHINMSVNI